MGAACIIKKTIITGPYIFQIVQKHLAQNILPIYLCLPRVCSDLSIPFQVPPMPHSCACFMSPSCPVPMDLYIAHVQPPAIATQIPAEVLPAPNAPPTLADSTPSPPIPPLESSGPNQVPDHGPSWTYRHHRCCPPSTPCPTSGFCRLSLLLFACYMLRTRSSRSGTKMGRGVVRYKSSENGDRWHENPTVPDSCWDTIAKTYQGCVFGVEPKLLVVCFGSYACLQRNRTSFYAMHPRVCLCSQILQLPYLICSNHGATPCVIATTARPSSRMGTLIHAMSGTCRL